MPLKAGYHRHTSETPFKVDVAVIVVAPEVVVWQKRTPIN